MWPVKMAVLVLSAAALLGVIFTLVAGKDPGFLIGLFVTVGAAIATLGVRRGGVYLFFPLPALATFVAAVLTGKVHDSQLASSATGTAVGFLQWIAGVFYPMCAATIVVLLIGGARWLLARQLVTGQFTMSGGRPRPGERPVPGDRPVPSARRPASDPWSAADPAAERGPRPGQDRQRQDRQGRDRPRPGGAPWLGQNGARSARPAQPKRPDRDPWGDPRPPADRNQPGPGPRQDPRAGRPAGPPGQGSPGGPGGAGGAGGQGGQAQPRPPRPQPRDPRDARNQRPQSRPRRDPWSDR